MKQSVILIILATFAVSLIVTLNIFLQENFKAEMAEQFNKQQLLLANTVSKNIENTFEHLGDEVHALAGLLGTRGLGGPGLGEFINSAFEEVGQEVDIDLMAFDRKGGLVYASEGAVVTELDRQLVRQTEGLEGRDDFIARPVMEDKVVKYFAPIRSGGRWKGALGLDVHLDSINAKFLAPIRSGRKGYAWMMSDDGTLLFHPTQPGMIGKNLHEADSRCYGCHKSFETELWILRSGEAGAMAYLAPMGEDKLIAFSRVGVFGRKWIICVSIPYSEVTASIGKSQKLHSFLILTIFGAAFAGAATMVVINRKRMKAEEKARHEEELARYASMLEKVVDDRTRELSTEKEKLNTIVNAIGGGLILLDTRGVILWANRQFSEMAGGDFVGRDCSSVCPDCSMISSQMSDNIETTVLEGLFDKKGRYFQITSAPVKAEGQLVGFIRLVQDVTEMRRVEEQLLHSEKLASLGRLTAGIAHEIGNPLTAVFSFLQILRDMETEEFKKESLETIMFHMKRIADIVRQLSSLSKIPTPEMKPVNINAVLKSAIELMRYDKRAANIRVVEEMEEVPEIVTDENHISQVFINLILNAVDAMPEGGTLTVRSKNLVGRVVVEVEDTGIGIPKEYLARIFDPFYTTKEKGTGLGLSVSYGIMKRLGGEINVRSEPGKGTLFSVIIPARRSADV